MDVIVEMRYGAHLYGTATPESDLDLKAVYVPEATDILLQRVRPVITAERAKAAGERNRPGDVDREIYSLQRYLELLAEGQTVALDMLFAPDDAMVRSPMPLWREIQANAPRLVTREAGSFVRYCRHQAEKYGIKGSRVAAARHVLSLLAAAEAEHGASAKLATMAPALAEIPAQIPHSTILDIPMPGGQTVPHLEICGRRLPFTGALKNAREIVQRLVDEYGQRALQAERSEGVDWKALSHAVRIGREAIELLETGRIVFPLRCADEILAIKRGERPYVAVAAIIEDLVVAVEAAAERSVLPAAPDREVIDGLVERAYRAKVLSAS